MTKFEIPVGANPVMYDEDQMVDMLPRIEEMIQNCDTLIENAKKVTSAADACITQGNEALQQLQVPLQVENMVGEAQYAVRQLKRTLGLTAPRQYYNLRGGHCTIQGKRPSNEDAHVLEEVEHRGRRYTISAVFDGHAGDSAAKFCGEHFVDYLKAQEQFPTNIEKALRQTFLQLDADFCKDFNMSGCTATTMVFPHDEDNVLYTANAGDARIIFNEIGQEVRAATVDHKPSSVAEKTRIEAAGSFVSIVFGIARVAGQLAVSRAIGDQDYKQFGLTAEPDTFQYEDLDKMQYVLLACDGLYDVMTNEEVDFAVQAALNKDIEGSTVRLTAIAKAAQNYMQGKVNEGDQCLSQFTNLSFLNFSNCKEPTLEMSLEDRVATLMTRIAYILGSMDNITCIFIRAVRPGDKNDIEIDTPSAQNAPEKDDMCENTSQ